MINKPETVFAKKLLKAANAVTARMVSIVFLLNRIPFAWNALAMLEEHMKYAKNKPVSHFKLRFCAPHSMLNESLMCLNLECKSGLILFLNN